MNLFKPKGWWGKRPTIPVVVLGSVAAACLTVAGITGAVWSQSNADVPVPSQSAAHSMDGKIVTQDPVSAPSPTPTPTASPTPTAVPDPVQASGDRFSVPAVGLDIPLDPVSASDGQITPPGFQSAYWITNMGVPLSQGAEGTVFVVMHSIRGGGIGPGNYLTNVQEGTSALADGSAIDVAGVPYHVTGWTVIPKGGLATDADIWANTPGKLVVITCLEHPDGSESTDNMVITASRN
ncbi:class F sortase [Glaciibacter psychrotolerans]|uniref:Class F sortase n=1 Tax=Glaciibacter psychrotolerans TaxID=670054 RepID=A0A7Z0ECE9_9MICO|nr:class F sortase [Leifsonia psychrotolerans]NYJ18610.1 hypothetical protein [Leifsonia psychrotolerans]